MPIELGKSLTVARNNVEVVFENKGDVSETTEVNLLTFSIFNRKGFKSLPVENTSNLTLVPHNMSDGVLIKILDRILDRIYPAIKSNEPVAQIASDLSWMDGEDFLEDL